MATITHAFQNDRFSAALRDLADGARRWPLWTALAWEDIKTTYRRSLLGAFWITASFGAFIIAKAVIFIPILGRVTSPEYYATYLALGFLVWQYMQNAISTSTSVFTSSESWIKNDPLPLSLYAYQNLAKTVYNFALTSVVSAGVMIYFAMPVNGWALLTIPAVILLIVNALWVQLFLGVLCTRHRDFTHLVQTIMRVAFFLTPVIWIPAQLGDAAMRILWWNPFAHFVWIFRTPLLDGEPATESWIFVGIVTAVGWTLALGAFAIFRRRIAFWF